MAAFVQIVGLAVVVYAAANLDDIFVLVGFFADRTLRARHVVAGQFLAIASLFLACTAASFLSFVIQPEYLGFLGLTPIAIGLWKIRDLLGGHTGEREEAPSQPDPNRNASGKILAVTAVTIANCSDDLGIWTPVLAVHSPAQMALFGLVFGAMTALWCFAAFWLVSHPKLGAPLRRYSHLVVPFVLIALGLFVLLHAGTLRLIGV